MDESTFNKFRELVYQKSGISLGNGKEALVSARISKRMRALEINDFREYLKFVTQDKSGKEIVQLLDMISTNVTSFFRESNHFDFLKTIVSEWLSQGQRRFRFWSAACSTGEEPYTMAMILSETVTGNSVDMKILATDISTRVLDKCREGTYEGEKLKSIPPNFKERYFKQQRNDNGETIHLVNGALKNLIVFKRLNLSTHPFPMRGPFDVIFCRNVMIYFDNDLRSSLLGEMYRLLKPNGYLMVGHSESLTGIACDFRTLQPSVYIKDETATNK